MSIKERAAGTRPNENTCPTSIFSPPSDISLFFLFFRRVRKEGLKAFASFAFHNSTSLFIHSAPFHAWQAEHLRFWEEGPGARPGLKGSCSLRVTRNRFLSSAYPLLSFHMCFANEWCLMMMFSLVCKEMILIWLICPRSLRKKEMSVSVHYYPF